MRIIAGEFRGRKLLPPKGNITRPITDRAKQSLFDVLTPYLEGSVVYDCFAGTGSMGLECLSRGGRSAVFFEADRSAVERLRRNIETIGVSERATVVAGDLFKWVKAAAAVPKDKADLIFLDPPYRFVTERRDELVALAARLAERHLNAEGLVIFRHDGEDHLDLPLLRSYDARNYGGMCVELLRAAGV